MPKYELSITVDIAEDFGSFQEVELKVLGVAREAGRNLLSRIVLDYEAQALEKRPVQKKDSREKTFDTLLGRIVLKRWRVWAVFKRRCVYPVDEWMGLSPREKVSPGLATEIVEQCIQRPYGQASRVCAKLSGVRRSVAGNWRLVQGFSRKKQESRPTLPDWKGKTLPVLMPEVPDPCPILGMDPDATYVRPRRKMDTNHEIKMAVLYRSREKKGKRRWVLGGKQVVIAAVRTPAEEFFNQVTHKAVTDYGLHGASRVVTHGDGDSWIKQFPADYCPQALLRLDPYHVFEKIHLATGVEKIPGDWMEDFYTHPVSLIHKIKNLGHGMAEKKNREKIEGLAGYLENNLEGMKPSGVPKKIKKQFPRMYLRGSGPIESNIFQGICQRFKAPRMMWSEEGLNNLSFLRQEYLNRSFDFKKVTVPKEHYRQTSYADELREIARDL